MNILVTGAAGFIGSNLANRLQQDPNKIYGFDNFSTGRKENLKGLNIEMVKDIKNLSVELIFHLGMPSSSPIYRNDRYKVVDGIKTTIDVLELAKTNRAKVVYASSSSLYNGNAPPFKEHMPIKITDFYTETRYFVERLAQLYSMFYDIRTIGLRLFSVYGPNDPGKGPYSNIITQFALDIAADRAPVIYGDGKQSRDFIHVDDVVEALIKASKINHTDILNVGTGVEHSFNDVVAILQKIMKKGTKPQYKENPLKNYVDRTWADTRKAESILGFIAKNSFEEGIERHIEWMRANKLI